MAKNKPKMKAISYVRFSSAGQAEGDSIRRQTKYYNEFCAKHNLEPLPIDAYQDTGISAFKGRNLKDGKLGGILKLAKGGEFEKDTVLVVESLDRLSRANEQIALSLFLDFLNCGLNIASVIDDRIIYHNGSKFYKGGNSQFDLVFVIIGFIRANEESQKKSERVRAAHQSARNRAKEKPPFNLPAWLKIENGKIIQIPERVKTLKYIFELALKGNGGKAISTILNKEEIPPWGGKRNKTGKWSDSYIHKLLRERRVLGECRFRTKNEIGETIQIGKPLNDFFPKIINEDQWHLINSQRQKRKYTVGKDTLKNRRGAGRKSNSIFRGVSYCYNCGFTMSYAGKGDYNYLFCSKCKESISYDLAFKAFKEILKPMNERFNLITNRGAKEQSKQSIKAQLKNDLSTEKSRLENYNSLLTTCDPEDMKYHFNNIKTIKLKIKELELKIDKIKTLKSDNQIKFADCEDWHGEQFLKAELNTREIENPLTNDELKTLIQSIFKRISFIGFKKGWKQKILIAESEQLNGGLSIHFIYSNTREGKRGMIQTIKIEKRIGKDELHSFLIKKLKLKDGELFS